MPDDEAAEGTTTRGYTHHGHAHANEEGSAKPACKAMMKGQKKAARGGRFGRVWKVANEGGCGLGVSVFFLFLCSL